MKKHTLFFFALLFCSAFAAAQSKEKAQNAFLQQLNTILLNSKEYTWNDFMQEGASVQVVKPFTISNDVLSMTLNYKIADSTTTIAMEAPIAKIKSVVYDHYLVLLWDEEEVTKQQFLSNSTVLDKTTKQNYLHIGTPVKDGRKEQEKLEKLLEKLLKYYKN